jgi:murein DD-endopeptidase MepM/ murein hydrolase activator NlpD
VLAVLAAALPPRRTPATPRPTPIATAADVEALAARLGLPIAGLAPAAIHDTFAEARGGHRHEATDIVAPRGTPVVAVDDGVVARLFTSVPGGLTVYELSTDGAWTYYYAHLDRYAEGLRKDALVRAGDVLGYVGTTGNAGATPHLHFAILKRDPESGWWEGTAVDPYPLLRAARAR